MQGQIVMESYLLWSSYDFPDGKKKKKGSAEKTEKKGRTFLFFVFFFCWTDFDFKDLSCALLFN